MKKSSSKSLTFALALSMGIILLASQSCRCHEHCSAVVQNGSELFSIVRSVDTVVVRDSVFVSERLRGDTVYLTRVEWRDRWRTRIVHDTVVKTDSITQVIEHPPERYIPPFYKRCTAIFWTLMALLIIYAVIRTKFGSARTIFAKIHGLFVK